MKTTLAILCMATFWGAMLPASANEPTDEWLAQKAMERLRDEYKRDIQTDAGRQKWHGKRVHVAIDTNTLTKVTRYADEMVFTDKWQHLTPRDMAKKEAAKNAKRPKRKQSVKGIPARLQEARKRADEIANGGVSNVTVTVTIGRKK